MKMKSLKISEEHHAKLRQRAANLGIKIKDLVAKIFNAALKGAK